MADEFDPAEFAASKPSSGGFDPAEFAASKPPQTAEPKSVAAQALEPITSYPATYSQMNRESREQIGQGVEQVTSPDSSIWERAKGVGNVALGGFGYATSPINAALRTVVGKPIENVTGIPKEYTEFAAGLALPGMGLSKTAAATKASVPTAEATRAAAQAAYRSPEVAALKIRPEAMKMFGEEAIASLGNDFDPLLAGKTFGLLEKATQVPEGAEFVTAKNFDTLRRKLGYAAQSADKTERTVARLAQRKIDDFLANVPENSVLEGDVGAARGKLTEARGNWAAAMRTGELDEATVRAERQAARAGVGGNYENATRQRVSEILNSKTKGRGLSDVERQALDDYVSGNFTRNGLRVATKVLGGDNPLMAAIHAGLAFPTFGLSLAAPLTGYALKRINDVVSARDLAKVNELLRSRSPLAQQTRNAFVSWSKSSGALALDPSAQNTARAALTAKFLADRLKVSGIQVDPSRLLLQGPGVGHASDEGQVEVGGPGGQKKYGGTVGKQPQFAHGSKVFRDGGNVKADGGDVGATPSQRVYDAFSAFHPADSGYADPIVSDSALMQALTTKGMGRLVSPAMMRLAKPGYFESNSGERGGFAKGGRVARKQRVAKILERYGVGG